MASRIVTLGHYIVILNLFQNLCLIDSETSSEWRWEKNGCKKRNYLTFLQFIDFVWWTRICNFSSCLEFSSRSGSFIFATSLQLTLFPRSPSFYSSENPLDIDAKRIFGRAPCERKWTQPVSLNGMLLPFKTK